MLPYKKEFCEKPKGEV